MTGRMRAEHRCLVARSFCGDGHRAQQGLQLAQRSADGPQVVAGELAGGFLGLAAGLLRGVLCSRGSPTQSRPRTSTLRETAFLRGAELRALS
jgi:hypothetical protein